MRHLRLKLCAVVLLVFGLTEVQAQIMYVRETVGTQTVYTLNEIQKLSFS